MHSDHITPHPLLPTPTNTSLLPASSPPVFMCVCVFCAPLSLPRVSPMHVCGAMHWGDGQLMSGYATEDNEFPSPRSHHLLGRSRVP